MEKELKFEGILSEFNLEVINDMLVSVLVEKNIYIENTKHKLFRNPKNYTPVLNSHFYYKDKIYEINEEILNEIYSILLSEVEESKELYKEDHFEIEFKMSAYIDDKDRLKYLNKEVLKANKELSNSPYSKLFFGKKTDDFKSWKEFILYQIDEFYIKDYLSIRLNCLWRDESLIEGFNIKKGANECLYFFAFWLRCSELSCKINFLKEKINEIYCLDADFIDHKEELNGKKLSVPKQIALLKVLGFFELEEIKKLTTTKLYELVAGIIGKNPKNSSDIRAIRGNIQVLKPESEENSLKYTSASHLEFFKKEIKK